MSSRGACLILIKHKSSAWRGLKTLSRGSSHCEQNPPHQPLDRTFHITMRPFLCPIALLSLFIFMSGSRAFLLSSKLPRRGLFSFRLAQTISSRPSSILSRSQGALFAAKRRQQEPSRAYEYVRDAENRLRDESKEVLTSIKQISKEIADLKESTTKEIADLKVSIVDAKVSLSTDMSEVKKNLIILNIVIIVSLAVVGMSVPQI